MYTRISIIISHEAEIRHHARWRTKKLAILAGLLLAASPVDADNGGLRTFATDTEGREESFGNIDTCDDDESSSSSKGSSSSSKGSNSSSKSSKSSKCSSSSKSSKSSSSGKVSSFTHHATFMASNMCPKAPQKSNISSSVASS